MMDLDRFKHVNDTYGHAVGDQVLRLVARTMVENLKGRDVIARYGGEEFVVVMPDTDMAFAYNVAERLRVQVESDPFKISRSPNQLKVTVSIGMACSVGGKDTGDSLLHRADQALYRAKREGRNRVIAEAA